MAAGIRFNMTTKLGKLLPPTLTSAQLTEIGKAMVVAQKERWSRGINADDRPARALAPVTAKGKQRYGAAPIRNMVMTGLTRDNFTLRKATATEIRAENTSRAGRMHASKAQVFEQMIGLAPSDQDVIFRQAYRAYSLYLQRAWRPE